MMTEYEAQLWDDFRAGDEQAFSRLFLAYYDALFGYGRKLVPDEELVKDCIQELFQKLWRRRESVGPVKVIKPYLFKALRRHVSDALHQQRKNQLFAAPDSAFDVTYSHEDFLISQQVFQEQNARLLGAINQLSSRQREALYLKFFDGFSYEKISEIMALNVQSLRNLIFRALQALRKVLVMLLLSQHFTAVFS